MQYAAKELCRELAAPKERSLVKLKSLTNYLFEYLSPVVKFHKVDNIEMKDVLDVYSDSDWADCFRTGKLTSGGVASLYVSAAKT